jgi:hypothetical protein
MITYRRKLITKKKEFGIWSFQRPTPKVRPQVFARCSGCGRVNDLTGGFFLAEFKDGKCRAGISGCQSCRYCAMSFSTGRFEKWPAVLSFLSPVQDKTQKEVEKIVSKYKEGFTAYTHTNSLVIMQVTAFNSTVSAQITYQNGWKICWGGFSGSTTPCETFEEAVDKAVARIGQKTA